MPVPHASDVSLHPIAADNWIDGPSIQVETTNILVGVAAVGPGIACDDLGEVAVGSGARAYHPGTAEVHPGVPQMQKPVGVAPASRGADGIEVVVNWLCSPPY